MRGRAVQPRIDSWRVGAATPSATTVAAVDRPGSHRPRGRHRRSTCRGRAAKAVARDAVRPRRVSCGGRVGRLSRLRRQSGGVRVVEAMCNPYLAFPQRRLCEVEGLCPRNGRGAHAWPWRGTVARRAPATNARYPCEARSPRAAARVAAVSGGVTAATSPSRKPSRRRVPQSGTAEPDDHSIGPARSPWTNAAPAWHDQGAHRCPRRRHLDPRQRAVGSFSPPQLINPAGDVDWYRVDLVPRALSVVGAHAPPPWDR